MKKWIRWQGLIAFVALIALLSVFWFIVIDGCAKRVVEKTGTMIAGAKVDLDEADVTFFPLGMTLKRLQVTDRDEPMTNAIEISRIAFNMDGLNLFRRKVIIEEMAVEGVRFGTPRKRSGAVVKAPKKKAEEKESAFAVPSLELPDIKEVLKQEELRSLSQIQGLKEDIRNTKADWKKRIDELPDKARATEYRKRIKELRDKGRGLAAIQAQLKEAKAIKEDIDRDLKRIREARESYSADMARLRKRMDEAERSPMDDVRRIRDKYSISPQGLQNLSGLLFGSQVKAWIGKGVYWYGKIKPLVGRLKQKKDGVQVVKPVRGSGVDVRFKEYEPLPNFLIRRVNASIQPAAGTFTGTVKNVTTDQDVLGKPLTFAFTGADMRDVKSVVLDGTFNHVVPAKATDTMNIRVEDYRVKGLALSRSSDLPVTLEQGVVDVTVNGAYQKETIKATIVARVGGAKISAGSSGTSNRFVQAVGSTLSKVSAFTLTADVSGTPEDYTVSVSSDLDRVLKDAAGSVVKEHADKLEQKLKTAVFEKAGGPLKELKESFGGLAGLGDGLKTKENEFTDISKDATSTGGRGGLKLPF